MTKEITLKEAADEINRLNRERDAIRAQLAEAGALFQAVMKEIHDEAECALGYEQICSAPQAVRRLAQRLTEAEARADAAEARAAVLVDANDGWKRREDLIAAENRRMRSAINQSLSDLQGICDLTDDLCIDEIATVIANKLSAAIAEGKDAAREGGGE